MRVSSIGVNIPNNQQAKNVNFKSVAPAKTTEFRLKVENEVVEKAQPKLNVNVSAKLDLDKINGRLNELISFNKKSKK
jgi:hypothetical protein